MGRYLDGTAEIERQRAGARRARKARPEPPVPASVREAKRKRWN